MVWVYVVLSLNYVDGFDESCWCGSPGIYGKCQCGEIESMQWDETGNIPQGCSVDSLCSFVGEKEKSNGTTFTNEFGTEIPRTCYQFENYGGCGGEQIMPEEDTCYDYYGIPLTPDVLKSCYGGSQNEESASCDSSCSTEPCHDCYAACSYCTCDRDGDGSELHDSLVSGSQPGCRNCGLGFEKDCDCEDENPDLHPGTYGGLGEFHDEVGTTGTGEIFAYGTVKKDVTNLHITIGREKEKDPTALFSGFPNYQIKIEVIGATADFAGAVVAKLKEKYGIINEWGYNIDDFFPSNESFTDTYFAGLKYTYKNFHITVTTLVDGPDVEISTSWTCDNPGGGKLPTRGGKSIKVKSKSGQDGLSARLSKLKDAREPLETQTGVARDKNKYPGNKPYDTINDTRINGLVNCGEKLWPKQGEGSGGKANSPEPGTSFYTIMPKDTGYYWIGDFPVYHIYPSGLSFNKLANLTFNYNEGEIPDDLEPIIYRFEDDYINQKTNYSVLNSVTQTIGSEGGIIQSQDGNFVFDIPQWALDSAVDFSVDKVEIQEPFDPNVECESDSDCGSEYPGYEMICGGNNRYVLRDYHYPICRNPGTYSSYCEEYKIYNFEEFCNDGMWCSNGQCVAATCSSEDDSDGGVNLYEFGVVGGDLYGGAFSDFCTYSGEVVEHSCQSGAVTREIIGCPNGMICKEDEGYCVNLNFRDLSYVLKGWSYGFVELDAAKNYLHKWINLNG